MSENYTPTTEDVRMMYIAYADLKDPALTAEFARWIIAHDAEVRNAALEEAAVIVDNLIVASQKRLDGSDYPDSRHGEYLDGVLTGEEIAARTIRAAKA